MYEGPASPGDRGSTFRRRARGLLEQASELRSGGAGCSAFSSYAEVNGAAGRRGMQKRGGGGLFHSQFSCGSNASRWSKTEVSVLVVPQQGGWRV